MYSTGQKEILYTLPMEWKIYNRGTPKASLSDSVILQVEDGPDTPRQPSTLREGD